MIEYVIDKADLHSLLRALGVLQKDEQILLVNNIDLRDYRKKQVSILVDNVKNGNIYRAPFEELTEKELENTLSHLYAFEQFLLKEFMQVHQQISGGQEELKKRNFIKVGEEDFGSFSHDMEEIKIDLDELTKIMDTLKQYMVDFDGMNQWWNNVQKRGDK